MRSAGVERDHERSIKLEIDEQKRRILATAAIPQEFRSRSPFYREPFEQDGAPDNVTL